MKYRRHQSIVSALLVGGIAAALVSSGCSDPAAKPQNPVMEQAPPSNAPAAAKSYTPSNEPVPVTPVQPALSGPAGEQPPVKSPVGEMSSPSLAPEIAPDRDSQALAGTEPNRMPAMAGHDEEENDKPVREVYACVPDLVVSPKVGVCPVCKKALKPTPLANPDPTVCVVSGEPIEHPSYAIVEKKAYAFCTPDCVLEMTKDPRRYLQAAEKRVGEKHANASP